MRLKVTSIGNSAGTLRGSAAQGAAQGDWIRPGIALYGASPLADRAAAELGLSPVMTLETAVIALREVPVGEGVGYGATWRATRPSRIAILAAVAMSLEFLVGAFGIGSSERPVAEVIMFAATYLAVGYLAAQTGQRARSSQALAA